MKKVTQAQHRANIDALEEAREAVKLPVGTRVRYASIRPFGTIIGDNCGEAVIRWDNGTQTIDDYEALQVVDE